MFLFDQITDIEAQIRDIQSKKKEQAAASTAEKGVGLLESGGYYDAEIYEGSGPKSKFEGYVTSIAPNDDVDDEEEDDGIAIPNQQKRTTYTAPSALMKDIGPVSFHRFFFSLIMVGLLIIFVFFFLFAARS